MELNLKPTGQKVKASYKSIYIYEELIQKINKIAYDNETSFNNVVISIIEDFFNKQSEAETSKI